MRTELKKLRVGARLTQEEFAEKVGVSRATYVYIERGERSGNFAFWSAVQRIFNVADKDMWTIQKLD